MSNGFTNYASYTELSGIDNNVTTTQTIENLNITGTLTLSNPLGVSSGGTGAISVNDARSNLAVPSLNDLNIVEDKVDAVRNYLSEEEVAVGTWFNGKTIYKKLTFLTTATGSNAIYTVPNSLPTDVEDVIDIQGMVGVMCSNNWYNVKIPFVDSGNLAYSIGIRWLSGTSTGVVLRTGASVNISSSLADSGSSTKSFVIAWYTKKST